MRCDKCGGEIGEGNKACNYCGSPVKEKDASHFEDRIKCKACGAWVKKGLAFCTQCGTPVSVNSLGGDSTKNKKRKHGKFLFIILTAISVLYVGFLLYYFAGKMGRLEGNNKNTITISRSEDFKDDESRIIEKNIESNPDSRIETNNENFVNKEGSDSTVVDPSGVEETVKKIIDEHDNIVRSISLGIYENMVIEEGITAFYENNILISIYAEAKKGNNEYSRSFYFVGSELVYAEYAGADLHQFYFENGELIRWKYLMDATDSSKDIIYDKEDTIPYRQWEKRVIDESSELVKKWGYEEQNSQHMTFIEHKPFYGIWCGASINEATANNKLKEIQKQGFNAQVFHTTDWDNLNTEDWYVVSAGVYNNEASANNALKEVKKFFPDAYVKYSGDWIGEELNYSQGN